MTTPQEVLTPYQPVTDIKEFAAHLYELFSKPKEELTNADCIQSVADIAKVYGTAEDDGSGVVDAYLPIDANKFLRARFDERRQSGRVEIIQVQEEKNDTESTVDSWEFGFVKETDGSTLFYVQEFGNNTPREDITPDDRFTVINEITNALMKKIVGS